MHIVLNPRPCDLGKHMWINANSSIRALLCDSSVGQDILRKTRGCEKIIL